MLSASLSRRLLVHRSVIFRALASTNRLPVASFSSQAPRKSYRLETQAEFDVDDYDHRSILQPPAGSEHSATKTADVEGDVDDYDHRILEIQPVEALEARGDDDDAIVEGDIDEYDHRILQAPVEEPNANAKEETTEGDIDDFDHRSLYVQPDDQGTNKPKLKLPELPPEVEKVEDIVTKWALGNVTSEEIQKEQAARAEAKKKEADIRHHAWE